MWFQTCLFSHLPISLFPFCTLWTINISLSDPLHPDPRVSSLTSFFHRFFQKYAGLLFTSFCPPHFPHVLSLLLYLPFLLMYHLNVIPGCVALLLHWQALPRCHVAALWEPPANLQACIHAWLLPSTRCVTYLCIFFCIFFFFVFD